MTNSELTINDLQITVNFIDIALRRGAVSGDEMLTVAVLREKLKNVVAAAQPEKTEGSDLPVESFDPDVADATEVEDSE